ncbi:MAG TPA: methyl-accepting chemotaxis protein [Candidatus Angelobacter sp.]|nr:methyl-accepting chemotaxis protein [Candidatus Angelobacter sp.]
MLNNMKLRTRMIAGFVLVALIPIVIGFIGLQNIRTMSQADQKLYDEGTVPLPELSGIGVSLQRMRVASRDFIAAQGDAEKRAKFEKQLNDLSANVDKISSDLERRNLSPEMRKTFEEYKVARKAYAVYLTRIIDLARAGKDKDAWGILWSDDYNTEVSNGLNAIDKMEEIKVAEAKEAIEQNKALANASAWEMSLAIATGLVLAIGSGLWLTRSILGPLKKIAEILRYVAGGDLTKRLEFTGDNEIAQMGGALNQSLEAMSEAMKAIGNNSQALAGSAEELSAVSHEMSSNAEETSAQASVVAAAAEQVTKNMHTVATSAEEMTATIQEIAKNAHEAAKVATSAVQSAEMTNVTMNKLRESSSEVGQVVKVITSIAQQTNLLALNATIEAARAGEAGKGFAVVANEVKELAKGTAKATEDISRKIELIQGNTKEAIDTILQIGGIIARINDISNTIATAVEEQSATTNEIARNVSEAVRGSTQVTENIASVATAARSTTSGAAGTQQAAVELARMASDLQQLVQRFKYEEHSRPVYAEKPPYAGFRGQREQTSGLVARLEPEAAFAGKS